MTVLPKYRDRHALSKSCLDHLFPVVAFLALLGGSQVRAEDASSPSNFPPPDGGARAAATNAPATAPRPENHFYIRKYEVEGGGDLLRRLDVETAVYPYLGPYRTTEDVEQARTALEQAYRDNGYQTVSVEIPPQKVAGGVIVLQVMQGKVARLRVHGSRYFSIDEIKREAPSLKEGQSPNFTQVTHDLQVLNDTADRRVTPTVRAGEMPGTVDVDLNVKDTFPIHGSLEINNRYSADTTPLRLNGSVSYDNLWQLEHSIGFSFQVSPEDLNQVEVFSGYYLARIPDVSWLSLMLAGHRPGQQRQHARRHRRRGQTATSSAAAPSSRCRRRRIFITRSASGFDYKHFDQDVLIAGDDSTTPVTYYPLSAAYSGTWVGQGARDRFQRERQPRRPRTGQRRCRIRRQPARSHGQLHLFPRRPFAYPAICLDGFQLFAKAQGQVADQPLVNSEQFSGGGLGTVRGYLESEELGDNGHLWLDGNPHAVARHVSRQDRSTTGDFISSARAAC